MSTISQTVQVDPGRKLQINTTCPTGLDLCVTIERVSDGWFYDPSDGTFKAFGSITDPYVDMTETPPGSGTYTLELDVTSWTDGNYNTRLFDCTVDPANPTQLDGPETIYVDGGTGAPITSTKTRIDENYSAPNFLCYTTSGGDPIEDAFIYVFDALTFDGDAPILQAVAVSQTNSAGGWVTPVFLDPGSYVVYFYKPNFYGPDTVNITVI